MKNHDCDHKSDVGDDTTSPDDLAIKRFISKLNSDHPLDADGQRILQAFDKAAEAGHHREALELVGLMAQRTVAHIGGVLGDLVTKLHKGVTLTSLGKGDQAEPLLRRILDHNFLPEEGGPYNPTRMIAVCFLAKALEQQGKLMEAADIRKEDVRLSERVFGSESLFLAQALDTYAGVLRRLGKTSERERVEMRSRRIKALHASGVS